MISRRGIIFTALILAGLALSYVLYWYFMAKELEASLANWIDWQRKAGATIDAKITSIAGFPFSFKTEIEAQKFSLPIGQGQWIDWSAPSVILAMDPWDFHHLYFHFPEKGRHRIQWHKRDAQSISAILDGSLSGKVTFYDTGSLENVELSLQNFAVPPVYELKGDEFFIKIVLPPSFPHDYREPLFSFSAEATNIDLPSGSIFQERVYHASLQADIMGPMQKSSPKEAIKAWSDAGGTLEIRNFSVEQQIFSVVGNATLVLNQDLQPVGSGRLEVTDFEALIVRAVLDGELDSVLADLIMKAAFLMDRSANEEGKIVTAMSISLQDRIVRIGPVPVLEIEPIRWDTIE